MSNLHVERSRSGRAKCRWCGNLIDKGILRVVQDSWYEHHYSPEYYHEECAGLRFKDKKKIEELVINFVVSGGQDCG